MTTLFIATRNQHKAEEISAILTGSFRYVTLNDFPGAPAIAEDADTFEGNAARKAQGLATWLTAAPGVSSHIPNGSMLVLADDSGLEVDALQGAPGVHSARFAAMELAGESRSPGGGVGNSADALNNEKLLGLLRDVPLDRRTARFRCVLALVEMVAGSPPRPPRFFDGTCAGHISFAPRGTNGFGYDPLFVPEGFAQSFAELGGEIKNRLSHRAKALAHLRDWLRTRAGTGTSHR